MSSKQPPVKTQEQLAEEIATAHRLLKALEKKMGEHPEIGQAILKLEMALNLLGIQTAAML
jgi:hypothetical protein